MLPELAFNCSTDSFAFLLLCVFCCFAISVQLLDAARHQPSEKELMAEAIAILTNETTTQHAQRNALKALQLLVEPLDNANGEWLCLSVPGATGTGKRAIIFLLLVLPCSF